MNSGALNKKWCIFLTTNYVTLPAAGWYIGGIFLSLAGIIAAYVIDFCLSGWQYDLSWKDIDTALKNIYKYGHNPTELCFRIGKRKLYIYRDEKGCADKPIRMCVRFPVADWKDLFDDGEFHLLVDMFGGKGMYDENRGPKDYGVFPRDGLDGCRNVLKFLFEKSVGGLRPDIHAQSRVVCKKYIWIEHKDETSD